VRPWYQLHMYYSNVIIHMFWLVVLNGLCRISKISSDSKSFYNLCIIHSGN